MQFQYILYYEIIDYFHWTKNKLLMFINMVKRHQNQIQQINAVKTCKIK